MLNPLMFYLGLFLNNRKINSNPFIHPSFCCLLLLMLDLFKLWMDPDWLSMFLSFFSWKYSFWKWQKYYFSVTVLRGLD